jgi:hypothetical protein
MTTTIEDGNRTNIYAKEPQMKVMEITVTHNETAERLNGRLAMLGVIAAIGAYVYHWSVDSWCILNDYLP